jgi:uncharacterized protein
VATTTLPAGGEQPPAAPPRGELGHLDVSRIAQDLQIRKVQVEAVVQLLDEGNTIPFITRYRKERTGGLDEEILRVIQDRVLGLRQLAERKHTIFKTIDSQGKLTDELRAAILAADNPKRLEDLYLPFKPKKRSLATVAREKGLEGIALAIWNADPVVANLAEVLPTLVNPEAGLTTPDEVLLGAQHILAEMIAESADVRAVVRAVLWDTGKLCTGKSEKLAEGQGLDYRDYFQFTEPVRQIPPHRTLAINRGEKENALQARFEWDAETGRRAALAHLPLPRPGPQLPAPAPEAITAPPEAAAPADGAPGSQPTAPAEAAVSTPPRSGPSRHRGPQQPVNRLEDLQKHPHREFLEKVTDDALARLLVPSLEREIRRELTHRAEGHAVSVFARNLRSKLLAPPLRGRRVLAVDPGFRTGCKLAALDENGSLLADSVVFPHAPQNKKAEARARLEELICRHQLPVIAIGNGTACRESEELVSELITELEKRRQAPPADAISPSAVLTQPDAPPTPAPPPVATSPQAEATIAQPVPPPSEAPPAETSSPPPLLPETTATPAVPVEAGASVPSGAPPAPLATPAAPPTQEGVAASSETVPPPPDAAAPAPVTSAAPTPPPPPPEPLPPPPVDLAYVIVNEAGASVYSASPIGREEFPNFDATLRGTISIGRRLQDPLSELVKIDPQHVGVGLYQHDVSPRHLRESLDAVIESCVNTVGVDLNTASVPLLRHVSGLNQLVARQLIEYRTANGPFRSREQLLQVPGIGEARYVQAAGFLKISGGDNPLDGTWIHPESYGVARQLLADLGFGAETLAQKDNVTQLREKLQALSPQDTANRLQVGVPTMQDIFAALARPGRDPREDLPAPIFKKGILKLEDLQAGMELKGTVLNVVDFGAFIDIGLKDSGLVHISQMANRYVKSPYDVVAVGDVVTVWVLSVDSARHRVSLTMIQPGTERKPPERRPPPPRRGAPRGHGPVREPGQQGQAQGAGQPQVAVPGQGPPRGRDVAVGGPRPGGPRPGRRPHGGGHRGGPPPQGRGLPPRGTTRLGSGQQPPRGATPPAPAAEQPAAGGETQPAAATPAPAPQPAPPPRKPRRNPPKPKLSQAALAGKESLGTFAELAAFWEAKKKEDELPAPAAAPPPPPPEAPAVQDGAPPPS